MRTPVVAPTLRAEPVPRRFLVPFKGMAVAFDLAEKSKW
jgi:hypothetical protein